MLITTHVHVIKYYCYTYLLHKVIYDFLSVKMIVDYLHACICSLWKLLFKRLPYMHNYEGTVSLLIKSWFCIREQIELCLQKRSNRIAQGCFLLSMSSNIVILHVHDNQLVVLIYQMLISTYKSHDFLSTIDSLPLL